MWTRLSDFAGRLEDPALTIRLILLILLLAAIPRAFILYRTSSEAFYHNDGVEYMEISRQLAHGNGFSLSFHRCHEVAPPDATGELHADFARTPLFPLLGAPLFFLPWDVTLSSRVVSLLLSLLAVFCVFLRFFFTVLLLLALGGAWRFRRRTELVVLLAPVFFGMAVSIPFLFVLRFRFPFFAPYMCILAGIMLSGAGLFLRRKTRPAVKSDR